jgi:hypothetical protein
MSAQKLPLTERLLCQKHNRSANPLAAEGRRVYNSIMRLLPMDVTTSRDRLLT